ncbi:rRNA-processing protein EBP2, putative [Plasmodium berghei]|uniref:rRNA-processing protein EBP2, putative n=3 Tax=Plasmodium berghei TaxID=5821 RepID=A0A509AIE1_PLABA|nr:rRNA-processing protein EBP2, putative [Plasmodium berghei ANKA]CXI10062.1 rRNA-processing protein EBP2, putative [Plasmodium berghei]SCL92955.1 rRNA-processing protein EBP2, putative [Plasmodium berghei]SCM15759.1 rRNA-processing protein EBP2, putative [Plasmodium berghei]VUC54536.1 rRNA-processing protein EBP2, putative [Plasmodium berghei ANKA]|eukprot:XP_034420365.1 rRNA-processing protein EBP2, putative [Plasmodium berghei ANKA]
MKDDNIMDIEKKKKKLKKKKNVLKDNKINILKNKKIKNSILSNNDDNQFIKQAMKQIKLLKSKKSKDGVIVNKKVKKQSKSQKVDKISKPNAINKLKKILSYNDSNVMNIKNILKKKMLKNLSLDDNIYIDEKEVSPKFSQNKKLLKKKLKEIKINVDNENNEWLEKLDLTCSENFYLKKINLFGKCDIRENELINFAHTNVLKCLQKLQNLNIPFNRPYDFLAEMLKSDIHMEKVRAHILKSHEMSEIKEKNKLKRLNKKFNKNGGSMKVLDQKKAIEKKKNLAKIDELKNNLESLNVHDFFQKHSKDADQNNVKNKKTKNKHIEKHNSKNKGKTMSKSKNNFDKDTKNSHQKSISRSNKIKHKFSSKGKKGGKNRKKKKFKRR